MYMETKKIIKNESVKEKFFEILYEELSEEVKLSVKPQYKPLNEYSIVGNVSIMDCSLDNDLGLDSLSFMNICFRCEETFKFVFADFEKKGDASEFKMSDTVGKLWQIVQEHAKGEN